MSRLDQHVSGVRNKLAAGQFLVGFAYGVLAVASVTAVAVVVLRLIHVPFPKPVWTLSIAGGVAVVAGLVYGVFKRPTAHDAAVAIDDTLGLREKFSTALYLRGAQNTDPFAAAAVRDAERSADNVSIRKRFPISFPRAGFAALGVVALAGLLGAYLPQFDLMSKQDKQAADQKKQAAREVAKKDVELKLNTVAAYPKAVQEDARVQAAKKELENIAAQAPNVDPVTTQLNAQKALQEAEAARQEDLKRNERFVHSNSDKQANDSQASKSGGENGPSMDGKEITAQMTSAKARMNDANAKFNNGTPEQKKQAEKQMADAAKQLEKLANDPAAMQKLQQQLQQNGVSQQQIQQVAQQMQQATQGNPQAQQQLQKMQQQMMAQMNGGKGPTQQQMSQIQSAMKGMQGITVGQAQAANMAQAAQQVANAMQAVNAQQQANGQPGGQQQQPGGQQQPGQTQAGKGQQKGPGGPQQANTGSQQNAQQGNQQANGPGQQPGGQTPGGQANAQQGSAQQGSSQQANGAGGKTGQSGQQPGNGGGGPTAEQKLAEAQAQLDAVQKDADQMAAEQNQSGDNGQGNGGNGNSAQGGTGQFAQGDPNQNNGGGQGKAGNGGGGKGTVQQAPFAMKQEIDPSQNTEGGRLLAKTMVKSDPLVGKSIVQMSDAQRAAVRQASEEVNEENIPKDAQKVVKQYFDSMQNGK